MTRRKMGAVCTALAFLAVSGLVSAPASANHIFYTFTDLGTLGGSETFAAGINNSGQVVGQSQQNATNPSTFRAFRTAPNSRINPATDNLGTLGGPTSQANGINASGQVVGSSAFDPGSLPLPPPLPPPTGANPATRAFRTTAGGSINTASDLGTLGGANSEAFGINASGQVVGSSETANGDTRAFRTTAGGMIVAGSDLGTLGGTFSQAFAINSFGSVVGTSELANGEFRAFLFETSGMVDLNSLIFGSRDFILTDARAINDLGQIVAFGRDANGFTRSVLLTAVPEPGSATLAVSGVLIMLGYGWRRRKGSV